MAFFNRIRGKVAPDEELPLRSVLKENVVMADKPNNGRISSGSFRTVLKVPVVNNADDTSDESRTNSSGYYSTKREKSRRQFRRLSFADEIEGGDSVLANVTEVKNNHYPTAKRGPDSFPPLAGHQKPKWCKSRRAIITIIVSVSVLVVLCLSILLLTEGGERPVTHPPETNTTQAPTILTTSETVTGADSVMLKLEDKP